MFLKKLKYWVFIYVENVEWNVFSGKYIYTWKI